MKFRPQQRYELGDLVLTVGATEEHTPWLLAADVVDETEVMVLGHEALDLLREALDRIHPAF